ncbi:MAG: ABC transporter permease [Terracidiphilus sp.]
MRWWQIKKRDSDLEREIESDLELEEEELREHGIPANEVRYAARRAFGNRDLIREHVHEAWGIASLERLFQDLRFALRQLVRNKQFSAVCILALALGIGAETTIYSVIHAVLIDPYPYRGAMRMVHIHLYDKDPAPYDLALDGAQFAQFVKSPVLDGAIAEDVYTMGLTGSALPEQLQVGRMSQNAFEYFGVPALLGREFSPSDGAHVAVLSYHFWKSHFGGRPEVIGRSLQLDRQQFDVIGVLPQRFAWIGSDVYVPLPKSSDPRRPANVYARTQTGTTDAEVEQALTPMLNAFAKETPANFPQQFKVHLVHINEVAIGRFKGFLIVLFLSVSVLLVLACVHVAILLLARGETRRAEIAMRKALGASTSRIARGLFTEALLLSMAGGGLGILFALGGVHLVHLLIQPLPSIFPSEASIALNMPVLLFTMGIASLTGLLCGVWPALRLCRTELRQTVDGGTHKLAGRRGARRIHTSLLVAQVALTILLLAGSGATVRKLEQLLHANLGYQPQDLASVNLVLNEGAHNNWADRIQYYEQIRDAIARDPEVISAAIGHLPPLIIDSTPVSMPGLKTGSGQVIAQQVSPQYFSTLGIPLLRGRVWTSAETAHAARLALINEAMRHRYWPNSNPVGQTLVLNNGVANGNAWRFVAPGDDQHFQVIGVVSDTPNKGLGESAYPAVYIPYSMMPFDGFDVTIRTRGDPAGLLRAIKEDVHGVEADQAVGDLVTAKDLLDGDSLGRERFAARLFTAFALLGFVFAVGGIYSVQSYLVAQRTRELGVRIALGASRRHIVKEVTRASFIAVSLGTGIGVGANIAFGQIFAHWTNGNVRDPWMLFVVSGIIFCGAVSASVAPALAATSVDPANALRAE